ncbi:chemotaxis protein CheB [uncultured Mucilaginibacter sp.]|uniref:chemotaxis protein CheB n=1 Tax=uncultured Mucilaginibacter sp. TaxID=797541 RepID=UPI0025E2619C|nr:chemotaxis protein CheB [uncultured Mucilaginibacter sp.]
MAEYDFYLIGIGSSAGGFDPLKEIVKALTTDVKAAVIVIQHIPAQKPSNLNHILQRITPLDVIAVQNAELLEPGKIYVMAEGKQFKINDGYISVEERTSESKINRTIDHCFKSMATEAKSKSIGVILSGAGYDGLEGAKAIEDEDGLVIVQDPITAQFPLMPQSLIANDHPDHVLEPKAIAQKLLEYIG